MSGTIAVAGALANKPGNGGEAWVRLSWVLGLMRLGLDVQFVEVIAPAACTRADGTPADPTTSMNVEYFRAVVERFGLADRATLLLQSGEALVGGPRDRIESIAEAADLLVNISGHLAEPALLARFRRRAYVDIDPGYTQYWHVQGLLGRSLLDHDVWFTVGLNIGRPGCAIPTGGLPWRAMLPPVVLHDWPVTPFTGKPQLTTVAAWRGAFGTLEVEGRRYGQKAHEWRRFVELPRRVPIALEAALHIDEGDAADRERLVEHGWRLIDPRAVASTPDDFRTYVQGSWGELSVAQGIYVETNSGWFSDRTTRYLASGRPVLVQDTGFSRHLPIGDGLLVFSNIDEAAEGAERILADPEAQGDAARRIAEEHFDSDRVLTRFLDEASFVS